MGYFTEIPIRNYLTEREPDILLYEAGGALGDATIECRDLIHLRAALPRTKIVIKLFPESLATIFKDFGFSDFVLPKVNDPFAQEIDYDLRLCETTQCDLVVHSFGGPFDAKVEYDNFDGVSLPVRPVNKNGVGYFWSEDVFPHIIKAREEFLKEVLGVEPPDRGQIKLQKTEPSEDLKLQLDSFKAHCKSPDKIILISVSSSIPPNYPRKGNGFPKTCSVEKWVTVAEELTGLGYNVIMTGGIQHGEVYSHNLKPGILNLVEKLDIDDLKAVMSHAPSVVVGGDSGPGHLASILGIPTVSVFPNQGCPEYWSPGFAPNISLTSPGFHPDTVENRVIIDAVEELMANLS